MLIARLAALLILWSCHQLEVPGQFGYAQPIVDGVDGDGFAACKTTAAIGQDVSTASGLDDDQGLPVGRFELDIGVPAFTASGFAFEEEGAGAFTRTFGGNPLLRAGANVDSEFQPSNAEASQLSDIAVVPVTSSLGIAADWLDSDFPVTPVNGLASDLVETGAPMLIGVLGAPDIGIEHGMTEVVYVEGDSDDVEAKFVDLDAMLTVHATGGLDLWVGCRKLEIDVGGLADNDAFPVDIAIDGIMLGGGVRF